MSRAALLGWAAAMLVAAGAAAQTPAAESEGAAAGESEAVAETEAAAGTEAVAAPEAAAGTEPARPAAAPVVVAATPPAPAVTTASTEVVPAPAYETGFTLGAGIAVGILNLPKLGAAPSIWGRLAFADGWAFELSVDWWLANEAELDLEERDLVLHPIFIIPYPPGGSRLRFEGFEAAAAVCPHRILLVPGELALCAGVRGGVLSVEADGFIDAEERTRALFALTVFARWHYRIAGPVGVSYSAALFVPFLRDRFGYVDAVGAERTEFEPAPVAGRLDLALTYSF